MQTHIDTQTYTRVCSETVSGLGLEAVQHVKHSYSPEGLLFLYGSLSTVKETGWDWVSGQENNKKPELVKVGPGVQGSFLQQPLLHVTSHHCGFFPIVNINCLSHMVKVASKLGNLSAKLVSEREEK